MMKEGHKSDIARDAGRLGSRNLMVGGNAAVDDRHGEQHCRRNRVGQQAGDEVRENLDKLRGTEVVFADLSEGPDKD